MPTSDTQRHDAKSEYRRRRGSGRARGEGRKGEASKLGCKPRVRPPTRNFEEDEGMDFQKISRVCIYDSLKQIDNEGHVTPWCTLVDKETWCMGGNSPEFCLVHMAIVSRNAALAAQSTRIAALEAELAKVKAENEKLGRRIRDLSEELSGGLKADW